MELSATTTQGYDELSIESLICLALSALITALDGVVLKDMGKHSSNVATLVYSSSVLVHQSTSF